MDRQSAVGGIPPEQQGRLAANNWASTAVELPLQILMVVLVAIIAAPFVIWWTFEDYVLYRGH